MSVGDAERPRVSIVLPVHDGARFLAGALASCLAQSAPSLEVIAVDDASHDETPQILLRAAEGDSRVRVIRHERNAGLPAALNTGFAASKGEYLTWTSDDNLYEVDALSTMSDHLERHPDVDLVYSGMTLIDAGGGAIGQRPAGPVRALPSSNPIGACFLYRRRLMERVGAYAEDLFGIEDYDYWIRAACVGRLAPLGETLYRYRVHDSSLSSRLGSSRDALAERCLLRAIAATPRWLRAGTREHLVRLAYRRGAYGTCLGRSFVLGALHPVRAATTIAREARSRTRSRVPEAPSPAPAK